MANQSDQRADAKAVAIQSDEKADARTAAGPANPIASAPADSAGPPPAPATPPAAHGDDVAALKAQIAAQAAQIEKLTELATRPDAPSLYDLDAMTGVADGTRNARPENGPVPLHFTTGQPIFKAERPTGKAG
jgi:hypothetical protein